jgi:hypothetical protein
MAKLKNNCITCHTSWYGDPLTTGMAEKQLLKMQYMFLLTSRVA